MFGGVSNQFFLWILLMCALGAYIKPSIFRNIFSEIEKVVNIFSIPEKIFPNIDSLMYESINIGEC